MKNLLKTFRKLLILLLRLQFFMYHLFDLRHAHSGDVAAIVCNFFDDGRTGECQVRSAWQEDDLIVGEHERIGCVHLRLIAEVRLTPKASDYRGSPQFSIHVDKQGFSGNDLDIRDVTKTDLRHLDALFDRKHGSLGAIDHDRDDKFVAQARSSLRDVDMTQRKRVETARKNKRLQERLSLLAHSF